MSANHIVVMPLDESLLKSVQGRKVVVKVTSEDELNRCQDVFRSVGVDLFAVWFVSDKPLSELNLSESLVNLPIALYVPKVGVFAEAMCRLPLLHKLNIKIFLSNREQENYVMLQALSSLNVYCGLYFDSPLMDAEEMTDLAHYYLYSTSPHAPIEPFYYLMEHYDPAGKTDFSGVYFDDIHRFVHMDKEGNLALSASDLEHGVYIGQGPGQINAIGENKAFSARANKWQALFLENSDCSTCEGWRVCLGKFSEQSGEKGCEQVFVEMLEGIEGTRRMRKGGKQIWQS